MPYPNQISLTQALDRVARWHGDREAVVDGAGRMSYGELREAAGRCAALLHAAGVRKGDRVAMVLHPSTVHAVALFGAMELGAVPAALHIRESATTLGHMLDRLAPSVLVYDESLAGVAAAALEASRRRPALVRARSAVAVAAPDPLDALATLPEDLARHEPAVGLPGPTEDDPALIVFSSGTTSVPKGVVHTHRTMLEVAKGVHSVWRGIRPTDRLICSASVSFVAWPALVLPFVNAGATTVFLPTWDTGEFLRTVARERITCALQVVTMWRMVLAEDLADHDLSSLRMVGTGGEPLDASTRQRIMDHICPSMFLAYGSSESAMGGTVMHEDEMVGEQLDSVGRPMLNADLRIVTPGGAPHEEVPPGEVGEVLISGLSMAVEIFDDPARTNSSFVHDGHQRWWRSRDLGRIDEAGYLHLDGRVDEMIISGGINVMPAPIENVLMAHPGVRMCAVVGAPDERWGQRVCAFVVGDDGLTAEALDRFVRDSDLAGYQRPRSYHLVDELPRTTTTKVDRRALRECAAAAPAAA